MLLAPPFEPAAGFGPITWTLTVPLYQSAGKENKVLTGPTCQAATEAGHWIAAVGVGAVTSLSAVQPERSLLWAGTERSGVSCTTRDKSVEAGGLKSPEHSQDTARRSTRPASPASRCRFR